QQLRLSSIVAGVAGLACAAAAARAQCDFYVQHVPDFDQRRQNTPTVPGLPGDGSMYCVPTSMLNWCAYISNHGYPNVCAGPRKWSNNATSDLAPARDQLRVFYMGPAPVGGRGGDGGQNGGQPSLALSPPGKFDVSVPGGSGDGGPPPADLYFSHL